MEHGQRGIELAKSTIAWNPQCKKVGREGAFLVGMELRDSGIWLLLGWKPRPFFSREYAMWPIAKRCFANYRNKPKKHYLDFRNLLKRPEETKDVPLDDEQIDSGIVAPHAPCRPIALGGDSS